MRKIRTHRGLTLRISEGSCDGQEKQYAIWLKKTYPTLTVEIGSFASGLFDENWDRVGDSNDYWEKYCNS